MRTYAGHSSATKSNELYRRNLAKGQTGLSVAFDLPTQCGYDSDDPIALPEVGKVGEDERQPCPNKSGDVLQEDESRSHVTDEPSDGRPEPPVIVSSTLLPCGREGLAGEPGSDEIHAATPRCTVEGGEVRPDRSAIQVRLFHPGHESGRCEGVPLNVSHGSGGDSGESEGELESSVTGAEMQGT